MLTNQAWPCGFRVGPLLRVLYPRGLGAFPGSWGSPYPVCVEQAGPRRPVLRAESGVCTGLPPLQGQPRARGPVALPSLLCLQLRFGEGALKDTLVRSHLVPFRR